MIRATAALLLACIVAVSSSSAVELTRDGHTDHVILLAATADIAERTAADQLAEYLERATGVRFSIVEEGSGEDPVAAIRVGPTRRARELGIDAAALGPEDWRILTSGDDLLLVGGRPRGTLYAVYRFLEEHLGVRWWTPYEESVPRLEVLELPPIDAAGRPAFAYRDINGVDGGLKFRGFNRANGHFTFLPPALGGNETYGPPLMAHDFYRYVPPEEFFESHPEYFSEIDGERVGERAQLCLTNDRLVELVAMRLRGYIEQGKTVARERREPPPRTYSISQNDFGKPCTCEACSRVRDVERGHSGSLVLFMNALAKSIERDYPEILLDTLAYRYSFEAPRHLRLHENVTVRLSALTQRDFLTPVAHRRNRAFQRAIAEWGERTSHLRIWGYNVTFGFEPNNLPLPNLPVIAADLRYYLEHGVEGVFLQHNHPIAADMRDLKLWVVFKLVEEPRRDLDGLVSEFTEGFYGPAGATVREYLQLLERAARKRNTSIRYPVTPEQYDYLDEAVLRAGQALFDRAEREVEGDPDLLRRLRHARLSLDRATLLHWDPALARPAGDASDGPAIDPDRVARRIRATAFEQIEIRIPESRREKKRQWVEKDLHDMLEPIP